MKKRKRRGVSFGTVAMLIITLATVALSVRVIPMIAGQTTLKLDDAQQIVSALTSNLNLPELKLSDIPIFESGTSGVSAADTPAPTLGEIYGQDAAGDTGAAATPTPTPPKKAVFHMTAAGVFLANKEIRTSVYSKESDTYDFASMLSYIQDAVSGEVSLFAFENLIDPSQKLSDLNTSSQALSAVKEAGFDIATLGYEKAMDLGLSSLQSSLSAIKAQGFSVTGAYGSAEERQNSLILNLGGVQVAFLHYQEAVSSKGKTNIKKADASYALALIEPEKAAQDIAAVRERGAQVIVVSVNWSTGDKSTPTSAQKKAAQQLADAGADVIIGQSQALQPITYLTGKKSDGSEKKTLVAYSTGALMTSSRATANISAVLLHLTLSYDPAVDAVGFDEIACSPVYFWRYKEDGHYVYNPVLSNREPPDSMGSEQIDVMERSLKRVREILADSPVSIK